MANKFTALTKKLRDQCGVEDCSFCGESIAVGARFLMDDTGNFCSRLCQARHAEADAKERALAERHVESASAAASVVEASAMPFGVFGSPEMRQGALANLSPAQRRSVERFLEA